MYYHCKKCNKSWNFPIGRCIFCGNDADTITETVYEVMGYSEVNIPSKGNEKTPYYVYILKDKNDNKIIQKSFTKYQIGDRFDLDDDKSESLTIGVVGTGLLGSQIAEYTLQHDYPTIVKTRSESRKKSLYDKIKKRISKSLTEDEVGRYLQKLEITTDHSEMGRCDVIIEAVSEDIDVKKNLFKELSNICNHNTIFATNTSSLSIDDLANITDRPDKFIGMHFFNPVHKMDLIELVMGKSTSEETKNAMVALATNLNKKPIVVKNSPGFIVNRFLLPQINEAVRIFEEGIATKEGIDSAIKLGLNNPMGPFELADIIGLDICVSILEVLADGLENERFKPTKLLYEMVNEGKLGYKSGEGFYKY